MASSDPSVPAVRDIVTTRVMPAPRELVWRAWTEPALLAQWWGPRGFRNTIHEFDLRPGGRRRFTMHSPDGADYPCEQISREALAPERLVFDHLSGHCFQVTATFEPVAPAATRVTFRMRFESADECQRARSFVTEANEQNFDRLEAVLAGLNSPPR